MRHIKFRMETDHEITGEVGFIANIHDQWENYIPTQPFGIGHDVLDHASNERGFFWQEVAALGSACFRTNFGLHLSNLSMPYEKVCAWDLVSSLRDNSDIQEAPKFRLSKQETRELNQLLAAARPAAIESWESEYAYDDYEDLTNFFESDENWAMLCGWFKYGFARAKRRFKNDAWSMFSLRERIERVVQSHWSALLEWADSGREFTLSLDYENGGVSVEGLPW